MLRSPEQVKIRLQQLPPLPHHLAINRLPNKLSTDLLLLLLQAMDILLMVNGRLRQSESRFLSISYCIQLILRRKAPETGLA